MKDDRNRPTFEQVLAALLVGAPAGMWAADGASPRASISDYWDIETPAMYYMPLTAIAVMLLANGTIREGHWYNSALGASMVTLTAVNWDSPAPWPLLHFGATGVFATSMVGAILWDSEGLSNRLKTALAGTGGLAAVTVAGGWVEVFSAFWFEWAAMALLALHYLADGADSVDYKGPRRATELST